MAFLSQPGGIAPESCRQAAASLGTVVGSSQVQVCSGKIHSEQDSGQS